MRLLAKLKQEVRNSKVGLGQERQVNRRGSRWKQGRLMKSQADASQANTTTYESYVYDETLLRAPLNTMQQLVLDLVVNKRRNVFITGSAGCGKSFVLKRIVAELRARGRNVAVTASTGVAALNIEGSTLHSFAGLSTQYIGTTEQYTVNMNSAWRNKKAWRDLDVLIIDEISMINSVYFDVLEEAVRTMRKAELRERGGSGRVSASQADRPFGGIQLVIVGDFLQLPPVIKDNLYRGIGASSSSSSSSAVPKPVPVAIPAPVPSPARRTLNSMSVHNGMSLATATVANAAAAAAPSAVSQIPTPPTPKSSTALTTPETPQANRKTPKKVGMCFEADSWSRSIDHVIELTEVIRQKDAYFVKMLNEIRYGECSQETIRTLERLTSSRGNFNDLPDVDNSNVDVKPTRLFTINKAVNELNERELAALPGQMRTFKADTRVSIPGWRTMDRALYKQLEGALKKDMNGSRALETLDLKVGAQVVLVKNLSKDLVNGRRGVVVSWQRVDDIMNVWDIDWLNEDLKVFPTWLEKMGNMLPVVKFDDGRTMTVGPIVFKIKGPHDSTCMRCQIPLQLAWAASVHRCQGTTLTNRCIVDLSRVWEPGQVYVALSRVTHLDNLEIVSLDPRKSIFAHPKAKEYYNNVRKENAAQLEKLLAEVQPLDNVKPLKQPRQFDSATSKNSFLPSFDGSQHGAGSIGGVKRTYSQMQQQDDRYRVHVTNPRGLKKVYAVARGRSPGVYATWSACEMQVRGYANASFKSFNNIQDAEAFLQGHGLKRHAD